MFDSIRFDYKFQHLLQTSGDSFNFNPNRKTNVIGHTLEAIMIKHCILILASITSLNCFGQQDDKNELFLNDTINGDVITKLSELTSECLFTIKICFGEHDCKGFLPEIDTLPFDPSTIDIRAEILKSNNGFFTIHYKYRESKEFITDTFEILCLDNFSSMALPHHIISAEMLNDPYLIGSFMPASTDERDVVFIKELEDRFILYERMNVK